MKLKKIASLVLAGVMAVSMLAGCGTGNNTGDKDVVVTTGVNASSVIAKLDKGTTDIIKFSASSSLQNHLSTVANTLGGLALTEITDEQLGELADHLAWLADVDVVEDFKDNDNPETMIYMGQMLNNVSVDYVVRYIAEQIDSEVAKLALEENNAADLDDIKDKTEYVKYSYAGDMAVVKVESFDGYVGYVYAYTITRTPTDAKVEL